MSKKIAISMAVLIVLLALALGYIGYTQYSTWKNQKDFNIYQEGANLGYEQAVGQLFQGAAQCQQVVPLNYNNQTLNLVNADCPQIQACLQQPVA